MEFSCANLIITNDEFGSVTGRKKLKEEFVGHQICLAGKELKYWRLYSKNQAIYKKEFGVTWDKMARWTLLLRNANSINSRYLKSIDERK
ncbi:unnamed protein product [Rhizophagus irregularis]|nr:unnamed protein product [Rhizophagus irregularis]CAB5215229.1 unnamed protein product [Rhizophagus irregularis]